MTNQDQAALVIDKNLPIAEKIERHAHACIIADALKEAGLLAPDAPQPYFEYAGGPVWEVNNGYSIEKERPGEITVSYHGEPAEPITPQEARSLAAALLAAANYLEEA